METRPRSVLFALALAGSGCAALTGGVEQDATEARREAAARAGDGEVASGEQSIGVDPVVIASDMQALTPEVQVGSEGFEESPAGDSADTLAELAVIVVLAAALTGFVRMYQRRLPLLGFLLGAAALLLSALAFLNSAT